ncbi:MAG: M3 family oligoendopeptidase [Clostridia bacterium]|nr:M3 family oligoendopeptidase [Clostridia bacterium]
MKFNDMPYSRPNAEEALALSKELCGRLTSATTFDEADAVFSKWHHALTEVETYISIALVRHTIDTEDSFYTAEQDYLDESMPIFTEASQNILLALNNSPFKQQFIDKYGYLLFKNIEIELKSFSPIIAEELAAENKLSSEYDKLIASAQIDFEGEKRTLSQLSPFKQSANDEQRNAAWQADGSFYTANAQRLDEIYDEMTKLRDKMARKMGYSNYIELGYYRMSRNSYDARDVEKFRAAVVKYIVPIADKLYRKQAERNGFVYPLSYSDAALTFRSGNPKPFGTPDQILEHGRKFYHELSPQTAEFIDFMFENELFDVLSRKGKSGGGYCTSFSAYKSPFIFANFNGTSHDVEVMTHEAGHAFAAYQARNIYPLYNQSPSLESCEVHSMSMEFFAWPWQEGWFGKDTQKFYYSHLSGALTFIPYGTMVDHFQHIVYENPEMTPEQRHDEWRKLTSIYMPWIALDGKIPFYSEGKAWQRQSHIYERPFYYIDYCLAQTVALQFWALSQDDFTDAWQRYLKFVSFAGTKTFTELVESAGLDTPFKEDALKAVSDAAIKWLDSVDASILK